MNERLTSENDMTRCRLYDAVTLARSVVPVGDADAQHCWLTEGDYWCVQEKRADQPGLLLKVLPACTAASLQVVADEPFVADERLTPADARQTVPDARQTVPADGDACYRFPTLQELRAVLAIVRADGHLQQQLAHAATAVDADGLFWVRDTARRLWLAGSSVHYYDPLALQLRKAPYASFACQRLSVVTF